MGEHEIVTYKVVMGYFKVGYNSAWKLFKKARVHYGIKPQEPITLGQIIKANNLEK